MWPPHTELVTQTLEAETFLEDLYIEALNDWLPDLQSAVLPTLDSKVITAAADEPPPDPNAVSSAQKRWEAITAAVIVPGVAALWADGAEAAAAAVGGGVTNIVGALSEVRDLFVRDYTHAAHRLPGVVKDQLAATVRDAPPGMSMSDLRGMVRSAVTPGSAMLRKVSRRFGYHGASILNHGLMAVAKHAGDSDRKQWISILDERTRDTHWVADGQTVPIDGAFTVGGISMQFPGDPTAPPRETANCRCRLAVLAEGETARLPHAPAAESRKRAARGVERDDRPDNQIVASASEEHTMTDTIEAPPETYRTFSGVIAFVGTPTSDHRMLAPDAALSFRAPPQPLLWMRSTGQGGHSDAVQVGVIEDMHADAEKVYGSGYLLNTPDADLAAEQLAHGITRPSIDIGASRWRMTDGDGKELDEDSWFELSLAEMERVMTTFIEAEIMAFTLVALPAFGETGLTLGERESRDLTVVAASAPAFREYPAGHFSDPQLTGPTLPTLLDDGRVVGHVACWGSCHRSVQTQCVQAPHSPTDYSHFHTSPAVRLDDGTRLPVGRLTVGTGHASDNLDGVPAQAHYDNTGSCWAIVRVGEDAHGIWFSGVPAPWASEDVIEEGLASPLSGDWRDFGQGLELVAALSVNTPGFAARGRDDELGRPVALVAALGPAPTIDRVAYLSRDDVKTAVAEALAEQKFAAEREAVLARAAQVAPVKSVRERIGDMLAAL